MNPIKIITEVEELPDTLWYPQKGSKNITDLYRGQPVAESISPKDVEQEELVSILAALPDDTLLYERLPGGSGASLEHWQQVEICLQQPEVVQDTDVEGQAHTSRKMYFVNMAKSSALFDFHYTNDTRMRENASKGAGSLLTQRMHIETAKSDIENLEATVFEDLEGKITRQDIRKVITALVSQPRTIGQVYKDLLLELVKGRATIGCETIEPGEIELQTEQNPETKAGEITEAEKRRRAKIASVQKKIKKIQENHTLEREETTRAEERRRAKIASVQSVVRRLSDMNFQQSEVLISGDFLINKDDKGAFVLSLEHPLSAYYERPIRLMTMGIKKVSPSYEGEYEKNIGKFKSLNIYGQITQRLNPDKEIYDIVINPYAIY